MNRFGVMGPVLQIEKNEIQTGGSRDLNRGDVAAIHDVAPYGHTTRIPYLLEWIDGHVSPYLYIKW